MTTHDSYTVQHIDEEQFQSLQADWTGLSRLCPDAPVFLSWEWIALWWQHYSKGARMWILIARDAEGGLAGIAPLLRIRRWLGPLPVRMLRFVGSGEVCPAHLDVLSRPGEEEGVAAAFSEYLLMSGAAWDLADLGQMAAGSRLASILQAARVKCLEALPTCCPFLRLAEDWDSFLKRVDKKLRRNLRYFENLIEREHPGGLAIDSITDRDEIERALEVIVEMHKTTRGYTSFGAPRLQAFHQAIAAVALEKGWLRLYRLTIDGHAAAMLYAFRYGSTVYAYQVGHAADYNRYSSGRLLFAHALRAATEEGAVRFDFLEGDQGYKYEWPSETRLDPHLLLSRNWRGDAYVAWVTQVDRTRKFARERLPWKAKSLVERVISGLRVRLATAG
jgi:CelD/BcsL family acetyltransferase involved in cellulose biosynthesis